jgi:endonuclease IV
MYGKHVNANGDLEKSLREARAKYFAVQIFTHGPRNRRRNNFDAATINEIMGGVPLYVHSSYMSAPWKGNNVAIAHVHDQLEACREVGARGLVIHLPKAKPEVVAEYLPSIITDDITILLEMTHVRPDPNTTYETPAKLDRLTEMLESKGLDNWGYCIDTAHIWAAGIDVSTTAGMQEWLDGIKYPERIKLFHLNGNSNGLASFKDTHIIPFAEADTIWHGVTPTQSGCRTLVHYANVHDIPVIMEINRGEPNDEEAILKKLAYWMH